MPYSLEFEERARRDLSRLDAQMEQQVLSKLNDLAEMAGTARHHALTGQYRGQFRLRVGDYRARYELSHANRRIIVLRVQHRREAYRGR